MTKELIDRIEAYLLIVNPSDDVLLRKCIAELQRLSGENEQLQNSIDGIKEALKLQYKERV